LFIFALRKTHKSRTGEWCKEEKKSLVGDENENDEPTSRNTRGRGVAFSRENKSILAREREKLNNTWKGRKRRIWVAKFLYIEGRKG